MAKDEKKNKKGMGRMISNNVLMLRYIAKYTPGLIVWMAGINVLSGVIGTFNTIYVAKYVLDGVQRGMDFTKMLPLLLGVLALNVLAALLNGLYAGSYFPRKKEELYGKMHQELFAKAQEMELACYDNPKFYNEFVWAMSSAEERALSVLEDAGALLKSVTMVGGVGAVIVSVDNIGIFVALIGLVIPALLSFRQNKLRYEMSQKQKPLQRKRDYTSRILYQPDYAKEIRLTPVKERLVENFSNTNKDLIQTVRTYGRKIIPCTFLQRELSENILMNGLYMAYLLHGALVRHAYTYGGFYALYAGTLRFTVGCQQFTDILAHFHNHSQYIERFRGFLEYEPKMCDASDAVDAPTQAQELRLEHVTFTYEGASEPTLEDVSLTIQPGEKVALVGYNGAGKTTLIKLFMRLYDVSGGNIYLGDTNIRDIKLDSYRRYFGVVFQDYQLLAATIAENVMMDEWNPADEREVVEALDKSGFTQRLQSLEQGTQTVLTREFDKKGVQLSGGEGQKVAIARVFPRNCQMVVLDEPSSALDPVSEYNVNQSMLEAAKDKTVIFISHRLSTTKIADRIIMLEKGRIIEQGSHEQLMEQDGKYAKMFRMQAEKYQEESA